MHVMEIPSRSHSLEDPNLKKKVVITAALAGAATRKEQNPAVPYTPQEFAEESYKAYKAGASIVHIHAKDPKTGLATADLAIIRETVNRIRDRCGDILINLSTAIIGGLEPEARIAPVLDIRPDLASLNTGTMNFAQADRKKGTIQFEIIFRNPFAMLIDFAKAMKSVGVKPELEVYDLGHIYNVLLVRKQGIFDEPLHFQFVFGVVGGVPFKPHIFSFFRETIPKDATWACCGVGADQIPAITFSVMSGGHMRVGLEDSLRVHGGRLARDNAEQVELAVRIAELAGRTPATPTETRRLLHLPQ